MRFSRWLSFVAASCALCGVRTLPASAQSGTSVVKGGRAPARVLSRVLLRVRPPVGDTLRMKMNQTYEMRDEGTSTTTSVRPMTASVQLCTRSVVLRRSGEGTELLSITDSVTVSPVAAQAIKLFGELKRALSGRRVRVSVAPDGGIRMLQSDSEAAHPAEAQRMLAVQMPPMLPATAVSVGETWVRDLPIPLSAAHDAMGAVRATFHLDSLAPDQAIAYVSMKGTFTHSHPHAASEPPADSTVGTVQGTLQIDRRLQWMTDSHMTVSLTSMVWAQRKGSPRRVHTTVTQWLRAVPVS